MVPVLAAVLIAAQCLLWYKIKTFSFFLLSLKRKNTQNYSLIYFKEGGIDKWDHLKVLISVIKVTVVKTAFTERLTLFLDILFPQLKQ